MIISLLSILYANFHQLQTQITYFPLLFSNLINILLLKVSVYNTKYVILLEEPSIGSDYPYISFWMKTFSYSIIDNTFIKKIF